MKYLFDTIAGLWKLLGLVLLVGVLLCLPTILATLFVAVFW
jgi:hypothetical protein